MQKGQLDLMGLGSDKLPSSMLEHYTLEDLGLVDAAPASAFESITRLATHLFNVPVALISIVQEDKDRQFFASQQGLKSPWSERRQTPMSHSFSQHVIKENSPLVVPNALIDPLVKDNLAIRDLDVIAYLGVPVLSPSREPIGALCIIQDEVRDWTPKDIELLGDLAQCVNDEIMLRASLQSLNDLNEKALRFSEMRHSIAVAFMAPDLSENDRFTELLRAGCRALDVDTGVIAKVQGTRAEIICTYGASKTHSENGLPILQATLANLVMTSRGQMVFHDLKGANSRHRRDLNGNFPGCYVGTPLLLDGNYYGVLEFSSERRRTRPWTEEELSVLGVISMFVCSHMGLLGQLYAMNDADTEMVQSMIQSSQSDLNKKDAV